MLNRRCRKLAGKKGRDRGLVVMESRPNQGNHNLNNRDQQPANSAMATAAAAAPGGFEFTFEFGSKSAQGSYIEAEVRSMLIPLSD